jgi:hypothetical protein
MTTTLSPGLLIGSHSWRHVRCFAPDVSFSRLSAVTSHLKPPMRAAEIAAIATPMPMASNCLRGGLVVHFGSQVRRAERMRRGVVELDVVRREPRGDQRLLASALPLAGAAAHRDGHRAVRVLADRLHKVAVLLAQGATEHDERQPAAAEFAQRMGEVLVLSIAASLPADEPSVMISGRARGSLGSGIPN